MPVAKHFLALMPDTISAQSGVEDGNGNFTASAELPVVVQCRISREVSHFRQPNGNEVTSTVKVSLGSAPEFNVLGFRYVLPDRYTPFGGEAGSEGSKAKSWKPVSGKVGEGVHHEVLRF